MKILLAGGTGFIGHFLRWQMTQAGHEVVVLSRNPEKTPQGVRSVYWDGTGPGDWVKEVDGCGAVLNMAGESVADGRWWPWRKMALVASRLDSTRALVNAIAGASKRPKVFINASAIGFYGHRGDEELDESSASGNGFLADLCERWEGEAKKAASHGVRAVWLRTGLVIAKEGGALGKIIPPFKFFVGGPLGKGDQWMSWIAREDLGSLILHCLAKEISGPLNATTPNPITNKEFSAILARQLDRPSWLPVPKLALRIALGQMAPELLFASQRVLPKKALESGFVFRYPDLESCLKASLD